MACLSALQAFCCMAEQVHQAWCPVFCFCQPKALQDALSSVEKSNGRVAGRLFYVLLLFSKSRKVIANDIRTS